MTVWNGERLFMLLRGRSLSVANKNKCFIVYVPHTTRKQTADIRRRERENVARQIVALN